MASQADVDLVISTAGALPELERDLDRIIRQAENGAPTVDVQAGLAAQASLAALSTQLQGVINRVDANDPTIDVQAALNTLASLNNLRSDVDLITQAAAQGADPVALRAELDDARSLRQVSAQVRALVNDVQRRAPDINVRTRTDEDSLRRVTAGLGRLGAQLGSFIGTAGRAGASAGALGVALGGLVPLIGAVAGALEQIAPAAAVGVSALLALKLATGTVQVAMIGMEEAIEAAFDPDASPEDLEKALKRLSPSAKAFVVQLRGMRGELDKVRKAVQERFFSGLDGTLRGLSRTVLPQVSGALQNTAGVLNTMAKEAANAAAELARDGTLGKALDGATKGLENLSGVPAKVVTGFGQIAAAAAPAFDKITRRLDTFSAQVAEKLTAAFESGALEKAIDSAISTIGQLLDVVKNFGTVFKNIFGGLTADGRGLFDILESISEAFVELTASKEFQTILEELAATADTLVANVLPLLKEAFVQLSPVIAELGPVVREFINAVGPELIPVIQELGPILVEIAQILKDQLPLGIELAKAALGVLVIALQAVHFLLDRVIGPTVKFIADLFNSDFAQAVRGVARIVSDNIGIAIRKFLEFRDNVNAAFNRLIGIFDGFGANLRDRFVGAVARAIGNVQETFVRLPGQIQRAVGNLGGLLFGAGADIIRGLVRGITSQVAGLIGTARRIADTVSSTIESALDINSPSKVTEKLGVFTGQGFENGILKTIPDIRKAVEGLAAPAFALPNGQVLPLPQFNQAAPTVQVFVGNEQLDARTDFRIQQANRDRDRIAQQGVRF